MFIKIRILFSTFFFKYVLQRLGPNAVKLIQDKYRLLKYSYHRSDSSLKNLRELLKLILTFFLSLLSLAEMTQS